MQVVSAPLVRITGDGSTEASVKLRWGARSDEVYLRGALEVSGKNTLRDAPQSVYSSALKLTLPAVLPARDVRVTYFDDELLIVRNRRNLVDILWRQPPAPATGVAGELETEGGSQEKATSHEEAAQTAGEEEHPGADNQEMAPDEESAAEPVDGPAEWEALMDEIAKLQDLLDGASVDSKAYLMKLQMVKQLEDGASKAVESRQSKREEKLRVQQELEAEVATLQSQAAEFEKQISHCQNLEESLRAQIGMLEKELAVGPRDSWPACRVALSNARKELATVLQELRGAKKSVVTLRRDLNRKSAKLKQKTEETDDELTAQRELEEQLDERKRELAEQLEHLSKVIASEEALCTQLASVRVKLASLQELEPASPARTAEGGKPRQRRFVPWRR